MDSFPESENTEEDRENFNVDASMDPFLEFPMAIQLPLSFMLLFVIIYHIFCGDVSLARLGNH